MTVRNSDGGVHVILDAGSDGLGVRDIVVNGWVAVSVFIGIALWEGGS